MTIRRKAKPSRRDDVRITIPHSSWSRTPQMQAGVTIRPEDFWKRLGL
ncbi:MAG TPA: hypothetical protein VF509_06700 [Sphingobium sp.]